MICHKIAYTEPEWFKEESESLADEWLNTDTELDIIEYGLKYGSEEFKKEYEKAQKIIAEAEAAAKKTEEETGEKVYWG